MVILFTWSRSGMMVSAFMPIEPHNIQSLIEFLAVGSAFGSIFAAVTFATAVFSLPMIADRDVDMVTAVVSSVNAVLRNKRVAVFWALLIALITALGFATAFIGLGLLMPWLAYSAWHSYRRHSTVAVGLGYRGESRCLVSSNQSKLASPISELQRN